MTFDTCILWHQDKSATSHQGKGYQPLLLFPVPSDIRLLSHFDTHGHTYHFLEILTARALLLNLLQVS